MTHRITLLCDSCETEFILEEDMDLPPNWFGVQFIIADSSGTVQDGDKEPFFHFCCQECLIDYSGSADVAEKLLMADRKPKGTSPNPDLDDNDDV